MEMESGCEAKGEGEVDAGREVGSGEGARRRQRASGVVGGSNAPADMRRRGDAARCVGRCGRMRVWRLSGVVVAGEGMARERSQIWGEKRIMRESAFTILFISNIMTKV